MKPLLLMLSLWFVAIAHAQDNPHPLRDCLDQLDSSQVSNAALFAALQDYETSRDIWLGYGVVGPRGYVKYDAPPPELMRFRQILHNLRDANGEPMTIWIGTSALTPDELYIFPLGYDQHGVADCSFYSVEAQ